MDWGHEMNNKTARVTDADRLVALLADAGLTDAYVENTGGWTMVAVVPCERGVVSAMWDGMWYIGFHAGDSWITREPSGNDGYPDWYTDVETDAEAVPVIARAVDEHGGGALARVTLGDVADAIGDAFDVDHLPHFLVMVNADKSRTVVVDTVDAKTWRACSYVEWDGRAPIDCREGHNPADVVDAVRALFAGGAL